MATLDNWPDDIHLIGAGGIGSHVLLALIELGARTIHVWDDDTVAAHNRPNQIIYSKSDVGKPKVDGMVRFVESQGYDTTIIPHLERVTSDTPLTGIVISGVDDMANRKDVWKAVVFNPLVSFYIDGRIGDDVGWVFALDPSDPKDTVRYETTLFDDDEVEDLSCTTRLNPHSALFVAQRVSISLVLFRENKPVKIACYSDLRREATSVPAPAGRP
jgi:molybdopterin/thiamine biosynthesis adenylyltransferase